MRLSSSTRLISNTEEAKMELYINSTWTKRYGNAYIAEAIAWSENGNHATIFVTGITADEADTKLLGALRELKLIPEMSMKAEQQ
jgi:hypothetical protein